MAQPVRQDLTCYKGETYSENLYLKQKATGRPFDLTGLTAKAQIRPSENSSTLTAEFTCTTDTETGKVNLELSAQTTASLKTGTYVWDLKMTDPYNVVMYLVQGKFVVTGRVTE